MPLQGAAKLSGSFRDPSGFVFTHDSELYRAIASCYEPHFRFAEESGLYAELQENGLLVDHTEVADPTTELSNYRIVKPERIPFVSYPYEWCFSQYRDAALHTLEVQRRALARGMTLKDASAYNIQFLDGRPIFIDTLSFEIYDEGKPWAAYRQFVKHFLAPLALMAKTNAELAKLMQVNIDGISLQLAAKLLPPRTRLNPGLVAHVHLHARAERKYADKPASAREASLSKRALEGLVANLANVIRKLRWKPTRTEWSDYYTDTNYSEEAFEAKRSIVAQYLSQSRARTAWDLGANSGVFSRIAAKAGIDTVSFDHDIEAVERSYQQQRVTDEYRHLPLVMDLTTPSPAIGWAHGERDSLLSRGPTDVVMALALIHHLTVSNNLPLELIAEYLCRLGRFLIIEFVPNDDSQVERLLHNRPPSFSYPSASDFEFAFSRHFELVRKTPISDSRRSLFLFRSRISHNSAGPNHEAFSHSDGVS